MVVSHMEMRRIVLREVHRDDDTVKIAYFRHNLLFGAKVAIISFLQSGKNDFVWFFYKILFCRDKSVTLQH